MVQYDDGAFFADTCNRRQIAALFGQSFIGGNQCFNFGFDVFLMLCKLPNNGLVNGFNKFVVSGGMQSVFRLPALQHDLFFCGDEFVQSVLVGFGCMVAVQFVQMPLGVFGNQSGIGFVGFGAVEKCFAVIFDFERIDDIDLMVLRKMIASVS